MLMYYFTVFHLSHSFFHLATSLSFVKSAGSVSWIGSHLFCFRDFVNMAAILSDSLVFSAVSSYISTTSRACFLTAPKALVQGDQIQFCAIFSIETYENSSTPETCVLPASSCSNQLHEFWSSQQICK